jgi:hypothetical protein
LAARSADLSTSGFFFMVLLENKSVPNTLRNLREGISEQISAVSLAMLLRVMENLMRKVHQTL